MVQTENLKVVKGDTLSKYFVFEGFDLTDSDVLTGTIKSSFESSIIVAQATDTNMLTKGYGEVVFSASDMKIAKGSYVYDIELRQSNGFVTTIARGVIEVIDEVTTQ